MNILYRYIYFRIKRMNVVRASLYLAKITKLSKAQKMQFLMDKGLTKAEAEAAILTALSSLGKAGA